MHIVNDYLATTPFDIYELFLFHLVVKHRSFTKAAEVAGLTQSAITRQMQGMENSLGLDLIERTTRTVRVTPAGEFLFHESFKILGDIEASLQRLRHDFTDAPKEIRVGVSQTIGLAYLPGFFAANQKKSPKVAYRVAHQSSQEILRALENNELDIGVVCPPTRLPRTLRITHRFEDAFTLITSRNVAPPKSPKIKAWRIWMQEQRWLLINESSHTGQRLRKWISRQEWLVPPMMQLDNFDLIINLVALGMGTSFVPIRALALYGNKHSIQRISLPQRFTRELVVVARRHRKPAAHLNDFIENILF
ncbi:MAG: LysR family transcriptional regulator [Verrucomicrobiota bacterium]